MSSMDFNQNRKHLESKQISNIGMEIIRILFHHPSYVFSLDNIRYLLNYISKSKFAPNELRGGHGGGGSKKPKHDGLLMGEAMIFGLNMRESLSGIGVKGNKLQKQQKEAIVAAGISLNRDGKVPLTQSNFIRTIIPHINHSTQTAFISKYRDIKMKQTAAFSRDTGILSKISGITAII